MTDIFGIFFGNIGIDVINHIVENIKLTKTYSCGIRKKNTINIDSMTIISGNLALTKWYDEIKKI